MDSGHKEGFICPMCMADLHSFHNLQKHFETKHSIEDKALVNQIKGVFSKAKEKLFSKDVDSNQSYDYSSGSTIQSPSNIQYDPSYWEPQEIGTTKSHHEAFKAMRDARIDRTVVETNKIIIRLGKILQLPEAESSKRKDFEKTLVLWVPDEDVPYCPTCGDKFNIARRRHHCRLCGAIMCTKCSVFLSAREAEDIIEMNRQLSKGSPQRRTINQQTLPALSEEEIDKISVRVCVECNKVLQKNKERLNLQLGSSLLVMLHKKMITAMESAIKLTPEYQTMAESLNKGEEDYNLDVAMEKRIRVMQAYEAVDVISKKIAVLSADDEENPISRGAQKLQMAIRRSASVFLQENMLSLPSLPSAPKLIVLQARRRAENERRLRLQREEARRLREEQRRQQEIERLRKERESEEQKRREERNNTQVQYSKLESEGASRMGVVFDPGWSADTVDMANKRKEITTSGV